MTTPDPDTQVLTEADLAAVRAATDKPGERQTVPQPVAVDGDSLETVTCPDCGTVRTIRLARREAEAFCAECDYPLFWARGTRVAEGPAGSSAAARRRLPGAQGATQLATLPCPACAERNLPGAEHCIRCTSPMVLPPPPAPVPAPAPEPVVAPAAPEPEPEGRRFPWWVLVVLASVAVGVFGYVYL